MDEVAKNKVTCFEKAREIACQNNADNTLCHLQATSEHAQTSAAVMIVGAHGREVTKSPSMP